MNNEFTEEVLFHLSCIIEARLSSNERTHLWKAKELLEAALSQPQKPVEIEPRIRTLIDVYPKAS